MCGCRTRVRILPQYVIYIERMWLLHGKRQIQEYQTQIWNSSIRDRSLILFVILCICFVFYGTLNKKDHAGPTCVAGPESGTFSYEARASVKQTYDVCYALGLPLDGQIELQRRTADFRNFFCPSEMDT